MTTKLKLSEAQWKQLLGWVEMNMECGGYYGNKKYDARTLAIFNWLLVLGGKWGYER